MILQVVFKEDMLRRDIEDLERRYQVQGIKGARLKKKKKRESSPKD